MLHLFSCSLSLIDGSSTVLLHVVHGDAALKAAENETSDPYIDDQAEEILAAEVLA